MVTAPRRLEVPSFDGTMRTLRIYTPRAYARARSARFPVAYFQDGQNVFKAGAERPQTWHAEVALERLVAGGEVEPWILVALDHAEDRFGEYSPWDFPRAGVRGRGEQYARYLIDRVKPFVDHTLRTRPEAQWTAAFGSSLGGLISLYLGLAHGDTFGRIGALSPTVMWSDARIFDEWRAHPRRFTRLYVDAGATEVLELDGIRLDYGKHTRRFQQHLARLGYGPEELKAVLEPGGQHSEVDWRRRLPEAMRWLLR